MGAADIVIKLAEDPPPLRLTAWDASVAGPPDSAVHLHLTNQRALVSLLTAPGDLGLVRAYVAGDLELSGVHPGDPYLALQLMQQWKLHRPSPATVASLARSGGPQWRLQPVRPAVELPPRWRRNLFHHTRRIDAETVRRHYDMSNAFYELVLGPTMTYSCALFEKPDATLEEAQDAKLDLVCRKLGLRPGMRLLDVGCGWGAMVLHAARHHGVDATGITLSPEQAAFARDAVRSAGLEGRVHILELDYRDVTDGPYDAVSSIGMLEHVGVRRYSTYFRQLRELVGPGGRLLNHCITRPDGHASAWPGAFTDRYVFPDGELPSPARVIGAAHDAGLEVRHDESLREHYAMTLHYWGSNLVRNW
ncbi:MAG: class I SAM-dependent methyltransferase, partial [Nocardioidaceae bacterium]|nr:class I SAM-dependent methyltransferase [Nocardioidaceae bacterium]